MRRRKAMRRLINEIKFTLGLCAIMIGFFGGMIAWWLVFGY